MNRLTVIMILVLILSTGCRKSTNNPLWERSFGIGNALFIKAAPDSGLVSCGDLGGKPYLIKLDRNKSKVFEYKAVDKGTFSSAWFNPEIEIAGGSSDGKMLITCIDNKGNLLWDTTFSTGPKIDYTTVCYLGNGNLVAVGTANPDSVNSGSTALSVVWFNTTGTISDKQEITDVSFIAANRAVTDNSGNIYLALTRTSSGLKPKATVAKYNNLLQKIWETELYNNPSFGASSHGICLDNTGTIYVSGKTELPVASGSSYSSFCAKLTNSGAVSWRKYPENTNSGSSVLIDENSKVLLFNSNCFVISIINPDDGSAAGTVRTFDACDSNSTDAYGFGFDVNYDGNIIMAGSKGGGFYLAMKPPVPQVTM